MKKILILFISLFVICGCENVDSRTNKYKSEENSNVKEENFFDKIKKKENKLSCMLTTPINDEITGLVYYETIYYLYYDDLDNEREKPYLQRNYTFVFESEQKRIEFFNSTAFEELTKSLKEDIEELNLKKGYIEETTIDRDKRISLYHMVKFDDMENFKLYYEILNSNDSNYICYSN